MISGTGWIATRPDAPFPGAGFRIGYFATTGLYSQPITVRPEVSWGGVAQR
jgi:hypothetical protein